MSHFEYIALVVDDEIVGFYETQGSMLECIPKLPFKITTYRTYVAVTHQSGKSGRRRALLDLQNSHCLTVNHMLLKSLVDYLYYIVDD